MKNRALFGGILTVGFLILGGVGSVSAESTSWTLDSATMTYRISFPMHHPKGISQSAEGIGECEAAGCEFEVSAELETFDSGNKKRDEEMMKTMRGDENPLVIVVAKFPQLPMTSGKFLVDLDVSLSGGKSQYSQQEFELIRQDENYFMARGTVPLELDDFEVKPPSLMGIKVKNLVPVDVVVSWVKADSSSGLDGEMESEMENAE